MRWAPTCVFSLQHCKTQNKMRRQKTPEFFKREGNQETKEGGERDEKRHGCVMYTYQLPPKEWNHDGLQTFTNNK